MNYKGWIFIIWGVWTASWTLAVAIVVVLSVYTDYITLTFELMLCVGMIALVSMILGFPIGASCLDSKNLEL